MKLNQFNPYKILHHLQYLHTVPLLSIQLDPCLSCNHDCIWCLFRDGSNNVTLERSDKKNNAKILPTNIALSVLSDAKQLGCKAVTYTGGGEPLIHPEIDKILERNIIEDMDFGINTNGNVKFNDGLLESLSQATYVRFSLDAGTTETYNKLHRPKKLSLTDTLNNIKKLSEYKIKNNKSSLQIGVSYLIHPENYNEIINITQELSSYNIDYIQFKPVYTIEGGKLLKKIENKIDNIIKEAKKYETDSFKVLYIEYRFQDVLGLKRNYKKCRMINYTKVIGADSKVYYCCGLKYHNDYVCGNLNEQSLIEIHNNSNGINIDVNTCPPCWYDRANEILEYLDDKNSIHRNFI